MDHIVSHSETHRRTPTELLRARNRQINAVHKISRELSTTLDRDERLGRILTVSMEAVEAIAGSILLHRPADDRLVFQHVVGPNASKLVGLEIPADQGIAGSVFHSGQGEFDNDPQAKAIHLSTVSKEKAGFVTENMVTIPLKYQEGRPIGVMQILNKQVSGFDESDLEVLEILASIAATAIQNAELHREAKLATAARSVGKAGHDIRNKLTPVKMMIPPMKSDLDELFIGVDSVQELLTEEGRRILTDSSKSLRRSYSEMLGIVEVVIDEAVVHTKILEGALNGVILEPKLIANELNPMIDEQLKSLSLIAEHESVRIVRQFDDIPPVRFDKYHLKNAVFNLVNNAIPETGAGGSVTVSTKLIPEGKFPEGSCVVITVADTGRGMPSEVLKRILRGEAQSSKPEGTGIGTRIVFNAVAAHKGVFEGESEEGVGTTFRIKIPYLAA